MLHQIKQPCRLAVLGHMIYILLLYLSMDVLYAFLNPDETDNETRLMQPDLPRGTSIRNIGGWFKGFLKAIDWVHYTAVGGGGGGEPTVTSTSTDKAKRYDEVCTFSNPQKSLNYNVALRNEEVVDKDDVDKYIWQHSSYALDDDGDILYGGCQCFT